MFDKTTYEWSEIKVISPLLIKIVNILQDITLFLTTLMFLLLIYIIYVYSPKKLGDYKYYLILNSVFGYSFHFVINIARIDCVQFGGM